MLNRFILVLLSTALLLPSVHGQSGEWKQLFNGKDLTGWKHVGPGQMTVGDGLIRTHGGMGLLYWTGGKLGNCVLRVVFKKCVITTTILACIFVLPSNRASPGCRCTY